MTSSRLLKNVGEAASFAEKCSCIFGIQAIHGHRQKSAKRGSLWVINDPAAMATQVVFQQPARTRTLQSALLLGFLLVILPASLTQAHSRWLLPSHTILSGDPQWISVDLSISNQIFHPDIALGGNGAGLGELRVTGPDGQDTKTPLVGLGRKSAAAVTLEKDGTYALRFIQEPLFLTFYKNADGSSGRAFGKYSQVKARLPSDAEYLHTTKMHNDLVSYVSLNQPTETALQVTGKGLELQSSIHPNELFVGESARFQLFLNGDPVPHGTKVSMTPGGTRFRNQRQTREFITDAKGSFRVDWQTPGMVLMEVAVEQDVTGDNYSREAFHLYLTLEINPE